MFETMDLQIKYLLLLQNFRESTHGVFDGFFVAMTWFGEIIIPVGFMALIYWGFNKRAGTFLLFNFGFSLYFNVFLKMTACVKRPWLIDERVCPLKEVLPGADGYSFPSGHTAGAMSVWGGSAFLWWKHTFVRYFMIALVFLVAFSRNYVGVHTPQDVVVSIIIGIATLFGVDKLLKWIDKKDNNDMIFYSIFVILFVLLYLYLHLKCCSQMALYNPLTDFINPLDMKHGTFGKLGFMVGIFTGWVLERRFVKFEVDNSLNPRKIFSLILGLLLLYLFMFFINKFFMFFVVKHTATFLSAFFAAIFITLFYPLVLKRFFYSCNSSTSN